MEVIRCPTPNAGGAFWTMRELSGRKVFVSFFAAALFIASAKFLSATFLSVFLVSYPATMPTTTKFPLCFKSFYKFLNYHYGIASSPTKR